ncbi:unnamed protein product [Haemonchus placei]|uniref:BCMA-Tall_bind domain-containing protein n=1 Tax=Haemonchus placei TaxID=6290 RepID=A0A0N4WPY7_HAEPC|nr:unnamed protein product [Haemonchus placei]
MCGGCSRHRDIVQNITACTMECQRSTIEDGKKLAQVLGVLEGLQRTREVLLKRSTDLTYLWMITCLIIQICLPKIFIARWSRP